LVGFFNLFYNFGETCRSLLIAKHYRKLGGKVIFFSHGGEHEKLAEDNDFKIIKVKPIYTKEFIDLLWESSRSSRMLAFKNPFSKNILIEHVEAEIEAYKKTGVKLIVSTNNLPCFISARAAGLPLITVTPKIISSYMQYPEDAEFFLSFLIPGWLKLKLLNWYTPRSKQYVKPFIEVAKKYNTPTPKSDGDIAKGDYTFYVDFIEFLGINKSTIPPNEFYTGHNFLDELLAQSLNKPDTEKEENEIENHIKRDGKSILFSLGSSGTKDIFLKILQALNKTDYNVIAVYTSILKEDELPEVKDNILLKKFVPSMEKLNKLVDLAIIHGGKATVYTAAYSGKPIIGIPMQFEQHRNIEILLKQGVGHMGSRKHFMEKAFLDQITRIFNNYNLYLKNAQNLAKKLPKPEGDKNAANKVFEITTQLL
jgi:spore coat polysaccharide biosynthesis predicted glycosyltransferase SpsG